MIRLDIPGKPSLNLEYAVFDFNGTLATDGALDQTAIQLMSKVKEVLEVYVITSDTYGTATNQCREMDVHVKTFDGSNGAEHKEQFVNQLGAAKTVCIGNGQNDLLMFQVAAISVVIIGAEGCSPQALMSADIAVTKIEDALNLLLNPQRMVATLRT